MLRGGLRLCAALRRCGGGGGGGVALSTAHAAVPAAVRVRAGALGLQSARAVVTVTVGGGGRRHGGAEDDDPPTVIVMQVPGEEDGEEEQEDGGRMGDVGGDADAIVLPPPPPPPREEQRAELPPLPTAAATATTHEDAVYASLDPEEVCAHLGHYIIGQESARRAVAVALRNRHRRRQIQNEELRQEITPSNMLMQGPTGTGKTEIARRVATLSDSPFIKVEATRYTEVGIVGSDTKSMVTDLMDITLEREKQKAKKLVEERAMKMVDEEILHALGLPYSWDNIRALREGEMDDRDVEVFIRSPSLDFNISGDSPRDIMQAVRSMFDDSQGGGPGGSGGVKTRRTVKEARRLLLDEKSEKLIETEDLIERAKEAVENDGIIFIDEIDKLALSDEGRNIFSRKGDGVQKELLALLEGTSVATRYGNLRTEHILFIACGAFHSSKPSDLMPELQGRLPVRVELAPLTFDDMRRILSEKRHNLVEQTTALLETENLKVRFTDCAIDAIAQAAVSMNSETDNIGARRLNTVMQIVIEEISFLAHRLVGSEQVIDEDYVRRRLETYDPGFTTNLERFIL